MNTSAAPRRKAPTISNIRVEVTHEGYRCKATVVIDGETRSRTFLYWFRLAPMERSRGTSVDLEPKKLKRCSKSEFDNPFRPAFSEPFLQAKRSLTCGVCKLEKLTRCTCSRTRTQVHSH